MRKISLSDAYIVTGLQTRTTNADESSTDSARLGALWSQFYAQVKPSLPADAPIYAIYHDYDSDASGAYSVTVGLVPVDSITKDEGAEATLVIPSAVIAHSVQVVAGDYLVFSKQGEMPYAVISLWHEIWQFFAASDCAYQRAYVTDVEHYINDDTVEILIGVV